MTSRGGVGFLVRLEYFFYMFSETEIFFQHLRGLEIFFLPMYDARSYIFYCTVRMNHTHSSSGGSVLVLLALIVLKHLHQGCGTPEDHHTTCSQARTQLLARGGSTGGTGVLPRKFFKIYM